MKIEDIARWAEQEKMGKFDTVMNMLRSEGMLEETTLTVYCGMGVDHDLCEKLSEILDGFAAENGPCEVSV